LRLQRRCANAAFACRFSLEQALDGYLWPGTQTGFYRFDGVHFELLTLPDDTDAVMIRGL
jgi:hypothetical protein